MSKQNKFAIKKLQLEDINELSIAVFICKTKVEGELVKYATDIGGILLSSIRGKGLSRGAVARAFGGYDEFNVVFVMVRSEVGRDLVQDVSIKFKFDEPNNGKGFLIDTDGYMGAKAAFV
ncbi:MAG: hypothetical protein IJ542_02785 [Clostridia bacterium]|nr:hypothetical protein [Clostridia bacterium]